MVLGVLAGCEWFGGAPDAGIPEADAGPTLFQAKLALAPADLPFEVAGIIRASDAIGFASEYGPLVPRSLWYAELGGSDTPFLTKMHPDALSAVAALPDRVVVVFPAAPDGVMTVAQGGVNLPWTAAPLDATLLRPKVGALDAVAMPDGSVLIAVRVRTQPQTLRLYRWRTDNSVTVETLDRGYDLSNWWQARCPDVSLDSNEHGDVALAFSLENRVGVYWRRPGDERWRFAQSEPLERDPINPRAQDLGCRTSIAFDGARFPTLLALRRTWPWESVPERPSPWDPNVADPPPQPPPPYGPVGLFGRSPPQVMMLGYTMRGDGLLAESTDVLTTPDGRIDPTAPWHEGLWSVGRHPSGFVISGTNQSFDPSPFGGWVLRAWWELVDFGRLKPTFPMRWGGDSEPSNRRFTPSEHFAMSACGVVTAFGNNTGEGVDLERGAGTPPQPCLHEPVAPIQQPGDRNWFDPQGREWKAGEAYVLCQAPFFAHGYRPYEVGLGLVGERLRVCVGGVPSRPEPWEDEADAPTLVSSSPAEGALVEPDAGVVTFTLSREPRADERVIGCLAHLDMAEVDCTTREPEKLAVEVTGATVRLVLKRPLIGGTAYRAAVGYAPLDDDSLTTPRWTLIGKARPAVGFRVAPALVDPRVVAVRAPCEPPTYLRDGGTCFLTEPVSWRTGTRITLGPNYDFARQPLGSPSLLSPDGGLVETVQLTPPTRAGQFSIDLLQDLSPSTTYLVRYPADIRDDFGALIHPDDLTWGFTTTAP